MSDSLRELNRRLDEILGRQERTLGLISQISAGGGKLSVILTSYFMLR